MLMTSFECRRIAKRLKAGLIGHIVLLYAFSLSWQVSIAAGPDTKYRLAPADGRGWVHASAAASPLDESLEAIFRGIPHRFEDRLKVSYLAVSPGVPAESIGLSRQPTLMETHGHYLIAGLVLLFAQLLLIVELLRERARERSARRALHESETRLQEAQSIAQCGSWVWDITRDSMYWSDEMYRILGLDPSSVTADRRLIHPDDDGYYFSKMREVSETHRAYSAEYRIVRPDGQERFVLESGHLKHDSHQKPVSMIGTLLDVTERRQTEQVLRESEERFRTMANGAPIMMWVAGVDKLYTDFNLGWLKFTGRPIEQEIGIGWTYGIHSDDLHRCLKSYNEAFDAVRPFTIEYRLRRYDSHYHWVSTSGSPRFLADGTFAGYIGCCLDIHDRKTGELTRLELLRRLMGAQEAERSRIARELHDGIGQEIALLSIQMQRALAGISPKSAAADRTIRQLNDKLTAIGLHVGRLSHQLHSSELEFLGLSVAITKLCREFAEQYPIKVTCTCSKIPAQLNNDVALTFLRIVQESLRNVAKHSGAKTVVVEVIGTAEELCLVVRDDGIGFDAQEPQATAGLGMISMRERMHLIGGDFTIQSISGGGTTIRALLPLATTTPATASE
jgi:PAS domain S-box-containing protein